jgi:hypothetical protein
LREAHRDICFLVGAERSGTTLLRLALNSHPQLAWSREFEYAVDRISHDGACPDLSEYRDWLSTHRIFRSTGYRIRKELSYPDLVRDFLEQQRKAEGKPRVGATLHRNFDRCLALWPNARFVHLVRDPRDVARSVVGMGWAGNTWTGVTGWLEAESLWKRMRSELSAERWIDVRYEDFVRRPEGELRRICALLSLPYDPAMLDFHLSSSYQRPDPRLLEQWKHHASRREIQWVESRAASLMAASGYELSRVGGAHPGPVRLRLLDIHDYWRRALFRVRRNGLCLSIADWIARPLGVRPWKRSLRLKLNAIEARHLQ